MVASVQFWHVIQTVCLEFGGVITLELLVISLPTKSLRNRYEIVTTSELHDDHTLLN